MKRQWLKVAALSMVASSIIGCNSSILLGNTYRKVIRQDTYDYYCSTSSGYEKSFKVSDIKITRSFINVDGAITYDIDQYQKYGLYLGNGLNLLYDNEDSAEDGIYFSSRTKVLLVWYNHEVCTLDRFLDFNNGRDIYSREDFMRIKEMYENNQNDFSIIDTEYAEE